MTQDEVLALFRQQADRLGKQAPDPNGLILQLAQLLADSRGRLSKEHFDALLQIGAVLYKEGLGRFQARADIRALLADSGKKDAPP